jgi:hypothetical protein
MAQQTAVEYLLEKLYTEYRFSFSGTIVDEAKAMEKEQIINAACYEPFLGDFPRKEGEHYYNKTYNK